MQAADAASLNYVRRGEGEPVVLIHGLGSFCGVWDPVIELLGERDVVAPDLPGFGGSAPLPPGTTPTVGALTDAVASFIAELGLERPLVFGNSLGGWIALELAKRGVPRAVVANSPAGFWSAPEAQWVRLQFEISGFMLRRLPGVMARASQSALGRRLTSGVWFGHPERVPPDAMAAGSRNLAESPGLGPTLDAMVRDRFSGGSAVHGPVTIAWGKLDRLLFPRQARRAIAQIPGARLVRIEDGGHVPMWDAPDEVARLVLAA